MWMADLKNFRKSFLDPNTTQGKERLAIEKLLQLKSKFDREKQRAADEAKRIELLNTLNQERADFETETRKSQAEWKAKELEDAKWNAYNLGVKEATEKRDEDFLEYCKKLKVELREQFLEATEKIRQSKDKEFEKERQEMLDEFQSYRKWMRENSTCRRL